MKKIISAQIEKHFKTHPDHGLGFFLKATVSAQLHLLGAIVAFIGLLVLLYLSFQRPGYEHLLACLIFGSTGVLVFSSSTLYHFCSDGFIISDQLDKILNDIDHFSIYLFIAGTYTPFLLNAVQPPWQNILLIAIWVIALIGIFYSYFKPKLPNWAQHRFISTSIFLAMGWAMIVRGQEVFQFLSATSFNLLLAGGLSYSVGAIIYALKWPNFRNKIFGFHEIWHITVMMGFAFHYFMVLGFYIK